MPMPAALLFVALLQSPSSVTVWQLSAPDRPGEATASQTPAAALDRRGRENLVSAGAPIGDGRRTAESAPDLSTRAQGRALASSAIGGQDRCQPDTAAAASDLCRRRIEARSGDYGRPGAAPVTAEGRLLVLSDPQGRAQTLDGATRRLGGSPMVDALAGSAAAQLAGAIDPQRAAAAATGATATLPAGVPSAVVVSPR